MAHNRAMSQVHWALVGVLTMAATAVHAGEIRDRAGLFSEGARRTAQATLDKLERDYQTPAVIETVESLNGETINRAVISHAKESGIRGVYTLIAKKEHLIETVSSQSFLGGNRAREIDRAFTVGFDKGRDFDGGLTRGTAALARAVADVGGMPRQAVQHGNRAIVVERGAEPAGQRGSSGMSVLLILALIVVGVIVLSRVMGRRQAYGPGGGMPMNGMGPGMSGGYGGGYGGGGGGGGFWSGMVGGIGGAMAGNWIYDQMSGRHHQTDSYGQSNTLMPQDYGTTTPETNSWGGDTGGMDWGSGGDIGGGGDFGGGGGGDWG